jgi:hypothetical protein
MGPDLAGQVVAECVSCRQPLTGPYCAQCGERVVDPASLTVRHFVVRTLSDEVVHLDGKFWRTLRSLLFRPGFLSCEYSLGRRRLYISPVKLLIGSILLYVVLTRGGLMPTLFIGTMTLSLAPVAVPEGFSVADTVTWVDRFGVLGSVLAAKQASADLGADLVRQKFHAALNRFVQPLSFTNVLLLAATMHLLFRRRRRLFLDHAVFSTHLVSFVLLSSLVLHPVMWLEDTSAGVALAIASSGAIWHITYLTFATRRFYFASGSMSRLSTLYCVGIAFLILVLNAVFISGIQTVGAAIALWSL